MWNIMNRAYYGVFLLILHVGWTRGERLVCYYDSSSYLRTGTGQMMSPDLDMAMQFCTHLVYGYAGLNPNTYEIKSLNVDLDMWHYREITSLKRKYPQLKVYLSVGGDKDIDEAHPDKYIDFLESGMASQTPFIISAVELLRANQFDGLDLAFQFPRNKPRKVHSEIGMVWKKFKKIFTGDFVVDKNALTHKEEYTEFVKNLKEYFTRANLSLSMTVLPNVNSTWYFDIQNIGKYFDMVNLAAFDFLTPQRNPEEADFTAPIYPLEDQDRLGHYNIDFQVKYWIEQMPKQKLNLGIPAYGRAWTLSKDSGLGGSPVVPNTLGPAAPLPGSNSSGLYSWPEICTLLSNNKFEAFRGASAPLRKVSDLEQKYGVYATRPANEDGLFGLWVSYDDPDFAGTKTAYAKKMGLGGIALFDVSLDDFRGLCTGQKFPILRSIKYFL